jgi:hypothetical protein
MAIRIPARTYYDTLEDYILRVNEFDYSSPDVDAFKAILNSDIEPQHLDRCILWYNSFDPTLHDRQAVWDVPIRNARPVYLQDVKVRKNREYDEETHATLRKLAEKGNEPPPKTQKERDARHIALMKELDPERYEQYQKERQTPKKRSFWPFGGKTRKH